MGKLHYQMKKDLVFKAYSPHTQRAYLRCARHFAKHYMRSPEEMEEQEVRGFLLHLARDRQASSATLDMSVNALKFLYNVILKRPEAVRDCCLAKGKDCGVPGFVEEQMAQRTMMTQELSKDEVA